MKKLLLFFAILSPFQTTLAQAQVRTKTIEERPLATAIQAALKNRPVNANDIQFLLDQGIREFNLGDFSKLDSTSKEPYPHEIKATAQPPKKMTKDEASRKIVIEFADPKTGKIMSFETVFTYSEKGSPEQVYDEYSKYVNAVTTKPTVKNFLLELPKSSLIFYMGLGLSNILSLVANSEDDPKVLERYLKSLVDPLGQLSFMAFIIGNQGGSYAMNSLLFSSLMSKTMSPKAKMRISRILIPQLGMAVGGLVSNGMYDLVSIVKGCSDLMLSDAPIEDRKKVCGQAMRDVFSSDNAYRYATSAVSMITTGLVLAYGPGVLKAVGSAIGRVAVFKNVLITISTAAKYIPLPHIRVSMGVKSFAYGVVHLAVFLKLDEWVFHPIFHHAIEKHASIGPELLKYQSEMQKRLSKTTVKRTQQTIKKPINKEEEAKLNAYLVESIKNYSALTMFDTPTPLNIKTYPTRALIYEVLFGGVPEPYTPLTTSQKIYNWTWGWTLPDFADNKVQAMNFSELLLKHYEASDKWRQSLLAKMQRQFQSWLETVAPFNAVTQMTYEFYHDFYEQAANIHSDDRLKQFEARKLLFEDDVLSGLIMRELDGKEIPESDISDYIFRTSDDGLNYQDSLRLNTVRQSVCWINGLLNYNERASAKSRSIHFKFIKEHLTKIKNAFAQYPEDIKCEGVIGTLTRSRSNLDMKKINYGLALLKWTMKRYANNAEFLPPKRVSNPRQSGKAPSYNPSLLSETLVLQSEDDPSKQVYMELNYLEQISHFLGSFTPYERGERFLEEWNATFKEAQPNDYKTLNHISPAAGLLRRMVCPSKAPLIVHDWNSLSGAFNKVFGRITFNPPSLVNGGSEKHCVLPFSSMMGVDFTLYNLRPNPKLGEAINYLITDSKPEIFGEIPSSLQSFANNLASYISGPLVEDTELEKFLIKFKNQMQGGTNRFVTWWDSTIEPQIANKFAEITVKYNEGVQKNLSSLITNYDGNINLNKVPDSLVESYLAQIKLYLDYILGIYIPLQQDRNQQDLAYELRDDILASVHSELVKAVNLSIDKDELTVGHAKTLALIKKFKSLIQAPDLVTKSGWTTSDQPQAVEFRDAINYYRKLLSPDNANALSMEWINELEARTKNDEFTSQAFREALIEVGKNYANLKPVYFSQYVHGNGIQPVKELFNFIVSLSESAYQLTQLTRLTTSSNYMEMDENGVQRRGKGSRKGF